jgi:7,8-dihydro-6-hydroxymethylpterin-pyrophosphokinase
MQIPLKTITEAKQSLNRCLKNPAFLDRFYQLFLSSSDVIKEKFKNTSFNNQKIVLKASLHIMLLLAQGKLSETATLKKMAERHSRRDLDIDPIFYHNWLECMIQAANVSDPEFTRDTEQAWREALSPGIDFFKSHH